MTRILLPVLLIMFFSQLLSAGDTFLNDVKVTGMKDRTIENCTVEFDGDGNIRISAPDVKVLAEQDTKKKPAVQYFISLNISGTSRKNPVQVFVNGTKVKALSPEKKSDVVEITDTIKSGENTVTVMAPPEKKEISLECIVGTGVEKKGRIELTPEKKISKTYGKTGLSGSVTITAE